MLALLLVVAAAAPVAAAPPPAPPAAPPTATAATIRGVVQDRLTRRPLPDAIVVVQETGARAFTDTLGIFELAVPHAGAYRLRAVAPSYTAGLWQTIEVPAAGSAQAMTLSLEPQAYRVPTVDVTADRLGGEAPQRPTRSMLASEIRRAPGGFQDPLRALQESRAIESRNDLGTLLSIRGGEPDQVLFLMDGFDVYNPYRMRIVLGGGLSLANPDIVESVELYAGGFSARHGNRTSGVIQLRTREGNRSAFRFRSTLSLVAASGAVEGPLPGGRGSWILGLRRTYYDLVVHPPKGEGTQYPYLQEAQARVDYDLSRTQELTLRASASDEGIDLISVGEGDDEDVKAEGGSATNSISLEHSARMFGSARAITRVGLLTDKTDFDLLGLSAQSVYADVETRSVRLATSHEWELASPPHLGRVGVTWDRYSSDVDWHSDTDASPSPNPSPDSLLVDDVLNYHAFFLEDLLALHTDWYLSIGVRIEDASGPSPVQASPRVALRGVLPRAVRFRVGAGQFLQYPDGIQSFSREAPLSVGPLLDLPPETAALASLGLGRDFGRLGVDAEAYTRDTRDLLVPLERTTYTARGIGRALARGLEVELTWRPQAPERAPGFFDRIDVYAAHAWIDSRFRGGIYDRWTPVSVERKHSFLGRVRMPVLGSLTFTSLVRFASGAPYTPLLGRLAWWDSADQLQYTGVWGAPFSARTEPYGRLDLRLDRGVRLFGRDGVVFLEVLNVTGRRNTLSIQWNDDFTERKPLRGLPVVPFLGLSL
jgi:hypothetical protein